MKTLLTLLIVFTGGQGYTSGQEDTWHTGEVMLASGDVLEGPLAYDLMFEVVKLRSDNRLAVFGATQVEEFWFMDAEHQIPRRFYTLPFSQYSDYRRLIFFELLVEGDISLFARERKVWIDPTDWAGGVPGQTAFWQAAPLQVAPYWQTVYEYYAADRTGTIFPLHKNPREMLLYLMQDQTGVMMEYLSSKKPDLSNRRDMIGIFMYYNTLKDRAKYRDPGQTLVPFDNKLSLW